MDFRFYLYFVYSGFEDFLLDFQVTRYFPEFTCQFSFVYFLCILSFDKVCIKLICGARRCWRIARFKHHRVRIRSRRVEIYKITDLLNIDFLTLVRIGLLVRSEQPPVEENKKLILFLLLSRRYERLLNKMLNVYWGRILNSL